MVVTVATAASLLAACTGSAPFAPEAGACLRVGEDDPAGPTTELTVVDCEEAHQLEVFHTFELGPEQTSGDARVAVVADTCLGEAFETYVGVPADASELELLPLPPDADQLAEGDRTVRCTVRPSGGGTTTGSVRAGSAN